MKLHRGDRYFTQQPLLVHLYLETFRVSIWKPLFENRGCLVPPFP